MPETASISHPSQLSNYNSNYSMSPSPYSATSLPHVSSSTSYSIKGYHPSSNPSSASSNHSSIESCNSRGSFSPRTNTTNVPTQHLTSSVNYANNSSTSNTSSGLQLPIGSALLQRGVKRIKISNFTGLESSSSQGSVPVSRRNERERNRVKMVNMGFATLRQHIPNGAKNKKMSKVETLRSALDYISQLQSLLSQVESSSQEDSRQSDEINRKDGQPNLHLQSTCNGPTSNDYGTHLERSSISPISPNSDGSSYDSFEMNSHRQFISAEEEAALLDFATMLTS